MRLFLACFLAIVAQVAPALADDSTKGLLADCRPPTESLPSSSFGVCVEVLRTFMAVGPYLIPPLRFCPGKSPAVLGLATLNAYVKTHPEALKQAQLDTMTLAFREKWPCK